MLANVDSMTTSTANKIQPISLRITDRELYERVEKLSQQQNLSMNMTVNMLLGFAFNEVENQNKTFKPKVVFESK